MNTTNQNTELSLISQLELKNINISENQRNVLNQTAARMTKIASTEVLMQKEVANLKRKIADLPEFQKLKSIKLELKSLKKAHSQLTDKLNGGLETVIADYEPNKTFFEKMKLLNGE